MINKEVCRSCQNTKLTESVHRNSVQVASMRKELQEAFFDFDLDGHTLQVNFALSRLTKAVSELSATNYEVGSFEKSFQQSWAKHAVFCPCWHNGKRAMSTQASTPKNCEYQLEHLVSGGEQSD